MLYAVDVTRRTFLRAAAAVSASSLLTACSRATSLLEPPPVGGRDGIRYVAANRGVLFGAGVNGATLRDPDLLAAHVRESALVVPMGLGNWDATRPSPTTFDFSRLDAIWSWAQSVQLPMRGIHLVWHNVPPWFSTYVTPANALQVMHEHITAVLGRYAGKLQSWSVVNEAVFPDHGRSDGLRNNVWMQLLGPGYIAQAFRKAAEVDPSAFLIYNEFGIEEDTPESDIKRQHTLRLLQDLVTQGVPIHGLGMQAHLSGTAPINPAKLTAFMNAVAALGLKIMVTELDVKDDQLPADIATRDALIAQKYYEFLRVAAHHPAVTTVIVWGLSDRITWLQQRSPRPDGLLVRPLPLDDALRRKVAWTRIVDALNRR